MDELDRRVRFEVLRHFVAEQRAPVAAEVARAVDASPPEVERSFSRLADRHAVVLAPGSSYLWMANPFSAVPTAFTVESSGKSWYGNCIWDALGILAVMGSDGRVSTWCPDCGESVEIVVRSSRVSGDGIVQYSVPARSWWDDIGFT